MPREVHRPGASARRRAAALEVSLSEFPFGVSPPREAPVTVFFKTRPIDPLRDNLGSPFIPHQRGVRTEQDEHPITE